MEVISYTKARNCLKSTMERVCEDHMPIVITRQNEQPVVMLSLEDYNAIQETLYLMRSPANAARLAQSIQNAERGNYQERELIEE